MGGWFDLAASVWLFAFITCVSAAITNVDLSGPGCDSPDGYYLKAADDVILLFAEPQYNTMATRDHCDVTINADNGRRIEYLIETIMFNECGVQIFLFDNPTIDVNPMKTITCNDRAPIQGKTRYNVLRLRVRKTTPQSRVFEFRLRVKNDLGPPFEFLKDSAQYAGQTLEPGVIAGIAIGGAIIIIALILLAIYLCFRARSDNLKQSGEVNVNREANQYTSDKYNNQSRYQTKKKYGSMEDVRSSTSSQEKTSGAYANPAYTTGPGEERSGRQTSLKRAYDPAGFTNKGFDAEDMGRVGQEQDDTTWDERETHKALSSERKSRKDTNNGSSMKPPKSALKKPTEIEMSKVNTQPINGILKTRTHSPDRSQTSSTDASLDANAVIYGYSHTGKDMPNVHHKPVIERKRTHSHRSGSSGRSHSRERRSQSADKKKVKSSRMYSDDVFIESSRSHRSRSGERRSRSGSSRRSRSERTSDSVDSASSTASQSRKVSMNPGGKRVHIKGEETDI